MDGWTDGCTKMQTVCEKKYLLQTIELMKGQLDDLKKRLLTASQWQKVSQSEG